MTWVPYYVNYVTGSKAFHRSVCSRKRCVRLWRCDVMAFESLTLTPFCMEILGVRKWIFQCFNSVFSAILVGIRWKYARIRPFSLFFTIVLQIFPVFSPGRDQLLGRVSLKNISPGNSPGISPLLDFWIPGLDSSIWLGLYAWAKSLVSRAILV